jgi:N-acetylglucosamine malate deacetylase 1
MAKVMAIVAHPDDEILSCGGALARHREEGDDVYAWILSGWDAFQWREARVRSSEAVAAAAHLGIPADDVNVDKYPEQQIDAGPETVQDIVEILRADRPSTIYTHRLTDTNRDHRMVAEAVLVATRPYGLRREVVPQLQVLGGVVDPFSIGPPGALTVYRVISRRQAEAKFEALRAYASETPSAVPHPRTVDVVAALMRVWGASIGVEYAEAFESYLEVS